MFFIQRNCGPILQRGKDKGVALKEQDRKALINHAHAYLSLKCKNIRKEDLILVSKTLVFIVPSLVDTTEGEHAGFVCILFNLFNQLKKNSRDFFFSFQLEPHSRFFNQKIQKSQIPNWRKSRQKYSCIWNKCSSPKWCNSRKWLEYDC